MKFERKSKSNQFSEDELVSLLSTHGMLVKRPLMKNDDFILAGFK
ncbi:MAG: hypothetical protein J6581_07005 [Apibacter sp.]|nr:hypothetical protein [Apibacter sp.]